MASPVLGVFFVNLFIGALIFAAWVVLNLWIWQKTKANSYLLLTIGSAVCSLFSFLQAVGAGSWENYETYWWLTTVGLAIMTIGYYQVVKPTVADRLAKLGKTFSGPPAGTPPSGDKPS